MSIAQKTVAELLQENEDLRRRLEEAEDTLRAISGDEVDAFVVSRGQSETVLTLGTADRPYRLLVEAMGQGAALIGADGTVLYINRRLAELLAAPQEKVVGADLTPFLPEADRPRFAALLQQGRAGAARLELTLRRADGDWLPVNLAADALPDGAGSVCLIVTDLTAQRKREEERVQLARAQAAHADLARQVEERTVELKEAQQKALQAERLAAIGQIAAGLAHESGNALQRSQACLSVLAMKLDGRTEEQALLARIQRAQDDLHRLYDEVREYAAPLQLNWCRCGLAALWREAWENLASRRAGRDVAVHEDLGGIDGQCLADEFRLRQVFRNLLENALAAGADRVEIRCSAADLDDREAIQVVVRDNGPGFAPGERSRLFEPFYTTKMHGTGLGLAICKRIIELHGGRIEAGPGPGAEIVIRIPRRQA